jgi:two-component system response regulator PilR (NtrC family)
MLESLPVSLDFAADLQQARAKLRQDDYEVVLTEAALPDGNWLDVLHLARAHPVEMEVVVTDPLADARLWSEALNLGAFDVISQPFYAPEVRRVLRNACEQPRHGNGDIWGHVMAAG